MSDLEAFRARLAEIRRQCDAALLVARIRISDNIARKHALPFTPIELAWFHRPVAP